MDLITAAYREMQQTLHESPAYGVASESFAPLVSRLVNRGGFTQLLDYGAGKGRLAPALRIDHPVRVRHYDPAVPQWSASPEPAQFVTCIDVLEHIEPELLANVLDDLRRVTVETGLFTIHTGAAVKVLPDGRNAHLIQQPPDWWLPRLMARFDLLAFQRTREGFWVVVNRKGAASPIDSGILDP